MTNWEELGIDLMGKRSGQVKVYCPQCKDKRKPENRRQRPLSVNIDEGLFRCHNCGYTNGKVDDSPFASKYVRPTLPESRTLTKRGREWLEGRSIDPDIAAGMGVYDDGRALTFPYQRDGKVVHLKHREMNTKRWWSSTDSEPLFYNLDAVKEATEILIVEGELDVLALATVGIVAISVPNGAPDEGQEAGRKLDCMESARPYLIAAEVITIATDNDAPGRQLANELVRRIGPEKCWRVQWPDGTKDANECLENYGPDGLQTVIDRATVEPLPGLIYGNEVEREVWDSRTLPLRRGVSTGVRSLDNLWRPDIGHTWILGATPSSGKSAFLNFIAHNMARDSDWKFAIFTPETFPQSEFFREMVQITVGKPIGKMSEAEFRTAMHWITDHFIVQSPRKPTMEEIIRLSQVCVSRHGTNCIVIDPFTNVRSTDTRKSRLDFIGDSLTDINRFKQDYGASMGILVHPTKPDAKRLGSIEAIGPYDLSGGAYWFDMSDEIIMLHRTDRTDDKAPVSIRVWKMRSRYHGKLGETQVQFDIDTGRYKDLGLPF